MLARRTPHHVVAEAQGHVNRVLWLDDLGRLLLFSRPCSFTYKCKTQTQTWKKCSYAENREISRRVAWIAELMAPQYAAFEKKRYKVDQHPKDPEPEPPSAA